MSVKRQATTQLTHENWDQDDPEDHEEMGSFKTAPKEVLEKRVIRTAKRRSQAPTEETKKSVFTGFGGFNKTQPSSFDFLANLTNGNKTNTPSKNDASVTSSLFSSKPPASSTKSGGLFGVQTTQASEKSIFGVPATQTSPFGSKNTTTSVFNTLKPDSTVNDSPFKIQPVSSSVDTNSDCSRMVTSSSVSTPTFGITSTASKSLFTNTNNGTPFKIQPVSSTTTVPATNNTTSKTTSHTNSDSTADVEQDKKMTYYAKLKGLNESVSEWIKTHVEETPLCILSPIFKDYDQYLKEITEEYEGTDKSTESKDKENKTSVKKVEKVTECNPTAVIGGSSPFSSKTTTSGPSLFPGQTNVSHEGENYQKPGINNTAAITNTSAQNSTLSGDKVKGSLFSSNSHTSNLSKPTMSTGFTFGITPSSSANQVNISPASKNESIIPGDKPKGILFGVNSTTTNTSTGFAFGVNSTTTSTGFAFGVKSTTTTTSTGLAVGANSTTTTSSTGFAFGVNTTPLQTTSSSPCGFSFAADTNTDSANSNKPFAFVTGKPFSFNSNIKSPVTSEAKNEEKEEEDEPPKVDFTPIVEENSVYDKRCKIFVKRDGNFVDKGVGTLYIKKIEETGKHQLLVRANTTLGNILLNLILASIPIERIGKNNVMLVCIPTPDEKPPPTPVLIRVKTTQEADELLEILKKYKT